MALQSIIKDIRVRIDYGNTRETKTRIIYEAIMSDGSLEVIRTSARLFQFAHRYSAPVRARVEGLAGCFLMSNETRPRDSFRSSSYLGTFCVLGVADAMEDIGIKRL